MLGSIRYSWKNLDEEKIERRRFSLRIAQRFQTQNQQVKRAIVKIEPDHEIATSESENSAPKFITKKVPIKIEPTY